MSKIVEIIRELARGPVFIDFEASSLRRGSFPIEAGLSKIHYDDFRTEAMLIRTAAHWNRSTWSEQSQAIHGISRQELNFLGHPPEEVANWFLGRCANRPVISEAPEFDQRWLDQILNTVGAVGEVQITNFDTYVATLGIDALKKVYAELDRIEPPHRAGSDAERLAKAYAVGSDHPVLKRAKTKDRERNIEAAAIRKLGHDLRIIKTLADEEFGPCQLSFWRHIADVSDIAEVIVHDVDPAHIRQIENFILRVLSALNYRVEQTKGYYQFPLAISRTEPLAEELATIRAKIRNK